MENKVDGRSREARQARSPRDEHLHEQVKNEPEGSTRRSPRVAFQSGGKLNRPPGLIKSGYRSYWALEGTVEALQNAWYELVTDKNGNNVTVPAGKRDARKLFLMQIEQKYYDEDMEAQQSKINEQEYGHNAIGRGEYSPNDGRSGEGSAIRREREVY